MIASTQLMNQAPYVKEDTDVTVVIPVASEKDVSFIKLKTTKRRDCRKMFIKFRFFKNKKNVLTKTQF